MLVAGGVLSSQAEPSFTLTVTSDAPGRPAQFQIAEGTSGSPDPDVPLLITSAPALYFGYQLVGNASPPQTITLTNIGQMPSTINSISADSGALNLTNNCPAILAANASCSIQVVFAPTTLNKFGGTISISHEIPGQQISIAVGAVPVAAAIQVSTLSVGFGSQFVGLNYQPRTVVLTNVSSNLVAVTSITPSSNYFETDNCLAPLPGGGTCRIFVSFTPVGNGEVQGTLTAAYNAAGSPAIIQLNGTGLIRSDLSISPLQLVFAAPTITGTINGPQTLTLQNTSANTLTISNFTLTPSVFSISANTCPSSLVSGATCTLNVSFMPSSTGPVSGTLTITNSGMGSPQIISVSGTGTTQVTLTGDGNFPDQEVGTVSAQHPIGPTNLSSTGSVTVTSVSVSGDFQLVQGGPGTIPAGYGTAYQVTFTPTATGPRTGTLTVVASDSTSPHQLTLSGSGVGGAAEISPSSIAFGDNFAGSISGGQTAIITNVSGAPLQLGSISTSGPFSQTNACGASLAAAASCNVMVMFSPAILGNLSGQLTVQYSGSGSPLTVSLTGAGTGPAVKLSPTSINFPAQTVGIASPPTAVTLTNQAGTPLSVSSISISGNFAQTNNCGASLASGSSCNINVTFSPTADGLQSGVLSLSDSGPNSPQTINLSGIGSPQPSVTLSATTLNFGGVLVNQGNIQSLTLTAANGPLTIQGFSFSSPQFQQQSSQCEPTIAVGVPCTVIVQFDPTALGNVSGTMQIHDDALNSPQSVQISGSGTHFILSAGSGVGQTITAGQAGTFTIFMNSLPVVNETVSLQCSIAPAVTACNPSPFSIPLTPGSEEIMITIQTVAHSLSVPSRPTGHRLFRLPRNYAAAVVMTALLLLIWTLRLSDFRVRLRRVFCLLLLAALAVGLISCGGGASGGATSSGTPSGTYTLTITGTSSNPANPPQTVQFTFTVD